MTNEITRTSDSKRFKKKTFPEKKEKPKQSAKRYAVWLLSRREYSASELRKKMIMRGYSEEEAEEAMRFVMEYELQSDARYAGMKARSTAHRAGNRRIEMVLKSKGIDETVAQEQIENLAPENERALQAASKFQKQIETEGLTRELNQKIWRFLSYRGFSGEAIKQALSSLSNSS